MELHSSIRPFIIYSIFFFIFFTTFLFFSNNGYVSIGYLYIFIHWIISKKKSYSFILDGEILIINNELKFLENAIAIYYVNIEEVKVINIQYSRRPSQLLELKLTNGSVKKYSSTKIKKQDFEMMLLEFAKHNITASYDDGNTRKNY